MARISKSKGGLNKEPTTAPPPAPKAQGGNFNSAGGQLPKNLKKNGCGCKHTHSETFPDSFYNCKCSKNEERMIPMLREDFYHEDWRVQITTSNDKNKIIISSNKWKEIENKAQELLELLNEFSEK